MSRKVKISFDVAAVNKRVDRSNGQTCFGHCPKLAERNPNGVTWRQIGFCPIRGRVVMPDTAVCPYGKRLIASASTQKSLQKSKSLKTRENGPVRARPERRKIGRP